jgi:hypothetical protein
MAFRVKLITWVDEDIAATALRSHSISLTVGILPILILGLPFSLLSDPWKFIGLVIGAALSFSWIAFWGWRFVLYFRGPEGPLHRRASPWARDLAAPRRNLSFLAFWLLLAAVLLIGVMLLRLPERMECTVPGRQMVCKYGLLSPEAWRSLSH